MRVYLDPILDVKDGRSRILVVSTDDFLRYGGECPRILTDFHRIYVVGDAPECTFGLQNLFHVFQAEYAPLEQALKFHQAGGRRFCYLVGESCNVVLDDFPSGLHGEIFRGAFSEGLDDDFLPLLLEGYDASVRDLLRTFLRIQFVETLWIWEKAHELWNRFEKFAEVKIPELFWQKIGRGLLERNPEPEENRSDSRHWYFNLSVTDACQYRCQFCNCWKNLMTEGLRFEEWKEILVQNQDFLIGKRLNFAGGEPFLKRYTEELIHLSVRMGIEASVATNAGALTRQRAHHLAHSGVRQIGISLDGFSENQTRLRGRPEAFEKVFELINWIREVNPEVKITLLCILMRDNLVEIPSLVQLAHDHAGVDQIHFQALSRLEPAANGWWEADPQWPDLDEVHRVLDFLLQSQREERNRGIHPLTIANSWQHLLGMKRYFANPLGGKEKVCTIEQSGFSISPEGELKLCPFHEPLGSLKAVGAKELLRQDSPEFQKAVKKIRSCDRLACHARTNCTFETEGIPGLYSEVFEGSSS